MPRPQVVGWGYTDGDPYTQWDNSNFAKGGTSASLKQQALDIPVLSAAEVCCQLFFKIIYMDQVLNFLMIIGIYFIN